eukprot:scaffold29974_cov60-Cyclotella_meneghiniana.AAC.10
MPLPDPGITCCKRGCESNDTHRVVDTPRPSTLGMFVAIGEGNKVRCKSVSARICRKRCTITYPKHLPAVLRNSNP